MDGRFDVVAVIRTVGNTVVKLTGNWDAWCDGRTSLLTRTDPKMNQTSVSLLTVLTVHFGHLLSTKDFVFVFVLKAICATVIMSAPPADADLAGPEGEGEPSLLVSEFPPPPYYYALAAEGKLKPPPIPTEALERGTRRAAAAGAKARAEAERLRLNDTDAILGGVQEEKEEEGKVVAVFGEIVEDPLLVVPQDYCEDPKVIAETVKKYDSC